jgi:hypothetical protein
MTYYQQYPYNSDDNPNGTTKYANIEKYKLDFDDPTN